MRAAEEADAELASVLGRTTVLTAVQKMEVLTELDFDAEAAACEGPSGACLEDPFRPTRPPIERRSFDCPCRC